jgi:HYDIN/CFA65/VesB family protein
MSAPETVTANFVPALSLSQNVLHFGDVNLGSTKYLNVTVKNISTSSFKITNITFDYGKGTGSDFGYTTECGGTLAPGKSCVIVVDLYAQDVGTGAATLNILYNLPSSPATVSLTGTVIDPKARLNESSINFGEVKEGQSSTSTINADQHWRDAIADLEHQHQRKFGLPRKQPLSEFAEPEYFVHDHCRVQAHGEEIRIGNAGNQRQRFIESADRVAVRNRPLETLRTKEAVRGQKRLAVAV